MNTKEVLSALDWITRNGDLRDYDDEIANRIEDAKDIVRSHAELLAAAKKVLALLNEDCSDWSDADCALEAAVHNAKKLP